MAGCILAASSLDVILPLWMSWDTDVVNRKQTWLTQDVDAVDLDVDAVTVGVAVVDRVVVVARTKKKNGS